MPKRHFEFCSPTILFPSNLTAFQNKAQEYLHGYKNIQHPTKSTRHAKTQKNTIQNEEKNQSKIKADLKNTDDRIHIQ